MRKVFIKEIDGNGKKSLIGSWDIPNKLNDNLENQKDLGWHVFMAIVRKAESIEIVIR